ncbi:selenocysteine-specific elongation factor [Sarotherodon galilaeus]
MIETHFSSCLFLTNVKCFTRECHSVFSECEQEETGAVRCGLHTQDLSATQSLRSQQLIIPTSDIPEGLLDHHVLPAAVRWSSKCLPHA